MDYLEEAEKILKYFDFRMTERSITILHEINRNFNFDLCLFGSFIQDYLIIKNNFRKISNKIFDEFLLYMDEKNELDVLYELKTYSNLYSMIVFEKAQDKSAAWAISTVNSCYKIELYPILMQVLYMYYNLKTDSQRYNIMLQLLVDTTIKCFANPDLRCDLVQIYKIVIENSIKPERLAV